MRPSVCIVTMYLTIFSRKWKHQRRPYSDNLASAQLPRFVAISDTKYRKESQQIVNRRQCTAKYKLEEGFGFIKRGKLGGDSSKDILVEQPY